MVGIPIDLPLPLPGPEDVLKVLLVITFIMHIFFVGLMLGGAYWAVIFKILGRDDPFYERLAREIDATVTINKSLAVVLGVAPLLLIGLTYTRYWYTANVMTAPFFLSIVWVVAAAFLFLFAYKYSWDMFADRSLVHLSLGLIACGLLTLIPLIFLTNINLMLLPYQWDMTKGFVQALLMPNVLPRYLHFLVATFAMIGFFAAVWFWYRGRNSDDPFYPRAQRVGLKWALVATLLQGLAGPFSFITLPEGSYSNQLFILIGFAIAAVAVVCIVLIRGLQKTSGGPIIASAMLLAAVAVLMSFMRHTVRENLLREPHLVAEERTRRYFADLSQFREAQAAEVAKPETGEELFKIFCASCHASDRVLVGPSLEYMRDKYEGKPEKMIEFVLQPSKVNPDLPAMPPPSITRQQAEKIVDHILREAEEKPKPQKKEEEKKEAKPSLAGQELFQKHCAMCHAEKKTLVGPPLEYMRDKYKSKPEEMIKFVLKPTKVNPDLPPMPPPGTSEEETEKVVHYILGGADNSGRKDNEESDENPEGEEEGKEVDRKPHPGGPLFQKYCSMCHEQDKVKIGPPVEHIVEKYKDKPEEMVKFVLNPKKVDPKMPPMPKLSVKEEEVRKIVDYILGEGK